MIPSGAHLHLLVNHLPILGAVFALLILVYGLARKSDDVVRLGLLAFVLVGVAVVGAQLTGEPAEEAVEHLAGVSEGLIHAHEEAAELSTIALALTGVVALAALVLRRGGRRLARAATLATVALGLVGAGLVARAGNLGGQIRHPEIRSGATAGTGAAAAGAEAGEAEEHGGERGGDDG